VPRGSDADAAGEELTARTGFTPNAEQMIAENQDRFSKELRAASNRAIDHAATDEMDEDDAAGYLEDSDDVTVLDYAVRGPFVVIVYEDEDGVMHKEAHTLKGKEKSAARLTRNQGRGKDEEPEESDDSEKQASSSRSTRRSTAASASSSE
jgi:hypothetical protein